MQKKRTGRMLCSLALSAVTLWGVSVTAPAKDARDALRTLKDETLGVMLLRYERGDGGEDFLSLRTSLALHATPLLREGEAKGYRRRSKVPSEWLETIRRAQRQKGA